MHCPERCGCFRAPWRAHTVPLVPERLQVRAVLRAIGVVAVQLPHLLHHAERGLRYTRAAGSSSPGCPTHIPVYMEHDCRDRKRPCRIALSPSSGLQLRGRGGAVLDANERAVLQRDHEVQHAYGAGPGVKFAPPCVYLITDSPISIQGEEGGTQMKVNAQGCAHRPESAASPAGRRAARRSSRPRRPSTGARSPRVASAG